MLRILILIGVLFINIFNISGQSDILLYENTFDDNEGLTYEFGDCDQDGIFDVERGVFVISDTEGTQCCTCAGGITCGDNCNVVNFPPINISNISEIDINVQFTHKGNLECTTDPLHTKCQDSLPDFDKLILAFSFQEDFIGQQVTLCCGDCVDNSLTIRDFYVGEACELYVRIIGGTQAAGEEYHIRNLSVKGKPKTCPEIFRFDTSSASYCEGSSFVVNAISDDCFGEYSYTWFKDSVLVSNTNLLLIEDYSAVDMGTYELEISNADCSENYAYQLTTLLPSYELDFEYQIDASGMLTASATNPTEADYYEWILNESIISVDTTLELNLFFSDIYTLCMRLQGDFCSDNIVCQEFTFGNVATNTTDLDVHEILISPNPVRDVLKIENLKSSLQIFNTEGKLMHSEESNAVSRVDVSSWNSGLYIVKSGNSIQKIVKL